MIGFSQTPFNVTINNGNSYEGNIFIYYSSPTMSTSMRSVKIINSSGIEVFSENWGSKGRDFKVNYNNKISYFDRSTKGWFIMDSLQNVLDSVYFQNGYIADGHDFLALPNGNYVLISYDEQPYAMDTIVSGGDPNAIIEGLIIQELDPSHNVIFEWKSWDHFHITDNIHLNLSSSNLPFIHANAVEIDFDGHLLISSRNLDEITKINRITGDIIWRLGGSQNDFNFINDYPFTGQHSIQSLGGNRYLLFDNGLYSDQYTGTIKISRAVEYLLDTSLMICEKVWDFVHPDSLYSKNVSSVQRLPNGNTLINFGNLEDFNLGSIITEVDQNNQIVFQIEFANNVRLYRAKKYDWFFYNSSTIFDEKISINRKLKNKFNILGKETNTSLNEILFYIYDDGTIEKRITID